MKFYSAWIKVARNRERCITLESEYAKTAEKRSVDNVLRRETHNKIKTDQPDT